MKQAFDKYKNTNYNIKSIKGFDIMERELVSKNKNTVLNEIELNEYLSCLDNFYIEYLKLLNINKNYTFGVEIEYKDIYEYIVKKFVKKEFQNWDSAFELNIQVGGEVRSPILTDKVKYWKELKEICNFIKENKASMDTGGHIHIGTQILGNSINSWKNFIYLYTIFEDVIYHFSNGDIINGRISQTTCAGPMAIDLAKNYDFIKNSDFDDLLLYLKKLDRFKGVNFRNIDIENLNKFKDRNTIEFRMPNGTYKKEIWQNNIYFFIKFLETSKKDFDQDLIDFNINKIANLENYYDYYKLNYNKAIKLADLIFDNNYDKARFLKQYVKDGREIMNGEELIKSTKKLIKN